MFVYDGGTLDAAQAAWIVLPPDELKGWAWSIPSEAAQRLPPLLALWITEALMPEPTAPPVISKTAAG
ncbi:hypothetical protein [Micromonospora aurantiaca (nom. illeg.)]|uniref:hypothetical protein n=1 Tax=Micromonospora aurantiaca (nom. illeg.) TaxID=47850 RepID=UPI0035B4CAA2